jgi:hypothetical protein
LRRDLEFIGCWSAVRMSWAIAAANWPSAASPVEQLGHRL